MTGIGTLETVIIKMILFFSNTGGNTKVLLFKLFIFISVFYVVGSSLSIAPYTGSVRTDKDPKGQ
jgi:hypothetical protein